MPYKSEKQRNYFHAHLNSLPKGSKEYNKWKKVVDKFDLHSVDESKQFLDEDFKSQEQNYIKQGNEPQVVKSYIERFKKIKDKNYRQLNDQISGLENVRDRKNIDSYKTFKELETIVDYVSGQIDLQGASLGSDIEIDGKPIYENDVFQIYYADSPRACIKYKGSIPYGWCVSRDDSSNMFYTYRFKENEPAFYFVKVKDRTKKELEIFNGQFKDKYHFFVIQTLKGARIGDTTTKQYVVTSAMNDADNQMSWDDIVAIEPRIANLQEIFKPVELKPEDKEFYKRFKDGIDDETFCKLDYTSKRRYLDIYVTQEKLLSDKQFKCLPEDLMNLYIGFGVGLYENEFELIKSNKNLLKRYQQITERKLDEYLKGRRGIKFKYTELLILPEDKRQEIIKKLDFYDIYMIFTKSTNPQGLINILGEKGKEFIMGLSEDNIYDILDGKSQEQLDKIINTLFNVGGKELDYNIITYLLSKSSNPQGIMDILGEKGKEFIMKLYPNRIFELLQPASQENRDKIINILFNVGGKEFMMNNRPDHVNDIIGILLRYSSNPQGIMDILGEKGKEFIMKLVLSFGGIDDLLGFRFASKEQLDKIINTLFNVGGKEFIMKLNSISINALLRFSSEPEKIKKILQKYGKIPKEETPMNENLNKNNMKTPLDELFNSFNNLKKELNEQNKENVKKKNLEKVNNFIKKKMLNEIGFDTPELAAQYDIQRLKGDITSRGSSQPDKYLTNAIDLKNTLENIIPSLKTAEPNISNASENKFAPKEMGNKEFLSYSFTKNVDENRGTYFIEKVFIYPIDGKVFDFITKSYVLENDVIARVKLGDFKEKLTIQQLNSALWKWLREYQNVPIAPSLNETKQRNLMKVQNFIKMKKNNR